MSRWPIFSVLILAMLMMGAPAVTPAWAAAKETPVKEKAATAAHKKAAPAKMKAAPPVHEEAVPAGEEKESTGFPQLNTKTWASQVVWLFVAFILLYVLMSGIALPRVSSVLETRRMHKGGNLEKASQMNEEAEKIRAAYETSLAKAQQAAADAMASAGRSISEKASEEQSRFADNSRKRLVAAEQNITKAKADALHSLADISAEIAADMVQKIADIQINKTDAKKAVMSVMQKG